MLGGLLVANAPDAMDEPFAPIPDQRITSLKFLEKKLEGDKTFGVQVK